MIVKTIQDLGKRMEANIEKMQKMFTKNLEELKNKQIEIGNLPEKEFRIMIMKMIQDLRERMEAKVEKMPEMFTKGQ